MKPITTLDEAKLSIKSFAGVPEDFVLPVSDEMQDPVGVNMAIVVGEPRPLRGPVTPESEGTRPHSQRPFIKLSGLDRVSAYKIMNWC